MNEEEPSMRTTLVAKLGAMTIAALLLAACGSLGGAGGGAADDYATDSGSQSGNASSGDAGQSDGGYSAGNDYGDDTSGGEAAKGALKVADSDFGQILTDSEGRSLYAFTKDTDGQSTCNAGCEENWPPLLADGKPSGSADVNGALKTVSREDGTKQVVIGKWPLYYFAGDNAPSDTQGQGVNDVWFLVGPDGKLVKS
jgi:predicted lipoprotein with Yx(FWY)xxD motif